MGTGEDAESVEHLSHEIFPSKKKKEDISLRSQHAYYTAPSSGFIKTRWNTLGFLYERRELGENKWRKDFLSE